MIFHHHGSLEIEKILRWIEMITIAYFQCNFPLNEEYAEEK